VTFEGSPWLTLAPKDNEAWHLEYMFSTSPDTISGEFYLLSGSFNNFYLERDKGQTLDKAFMGWGKVCH
jgi:hypothetical protein